MRNSNLVLKIQLLSWCAILLVATARHAATAALHTSAVRQQNGRRVAPPGGAQYEQRQHSGSAGEAPPPAQHDRPQDRQARAVVLNEQPTPEGLAHITAASNVDGSRRERSRSLQRITRRACAQEHPDASTMKYVERRVAPIAARIANPDPNARLLTSDTVIDVYFHVISAGAP